MHDKDCLDYYESCGKSCHVPEEDIYICKKKKKLYRPTLGVFLDVFLGGIFYFFLRHMCVLMPICEEISGLTSEVVHFIYSHGRSSYMAIVQLLTLLIWN